MEGKSLPQLLHEPLGPQMVSDREMEHLAPAMVEDKEHPQELESGDWYREEVHPR